MKEETEKLIKKLYGKNADSFISAFELIPKGEERVRDDKRV